MSLVGFARKSSTVRVAALAPAALASLLALCDCSRRDASAREGPTASRAAPAGYGARPESSPSGPKRDCTPACSRIERCDAGRCVSGCPKGEVFIPATSAEGFVMGRGEPGDPDRAHRVILTRPFCMDETEVTVSAYGRCVASGACTIPQLRDPNSNYRPEYQRPNHPLNMVNWQQAKTYCESRGQALPTEAQWEWAASRGDGRTYPWGNEPEPTCESGHADFTPGGSPKTDPAGNVGCHGGGSSEVKAHPNGRVAWPAGDLYDMAGNLWEWTADCYLPYPAETLTDPSPQVHPDLHGDCYVRSLRGGGWNRSKTALRTFLRAGSKRTYRVPALGFRCVRNAS